MNGLTISFVCTHTIMSLTEGQKYNEGCTEIPISANILLATGEWMPFNEAFVLIQFCILVL